MTHPRLRIALCALLLTAPLATVSAGGMFAAGDFYTSLNYDVAFAGERGVTVGTGDQAIEANLETDWGFLGAQLGIGFAISGFRPEFYGAYRRAPISGATLTKVPGLNDAERAATNKAVEENVEWAGSSVSSLDLGLGVHYDIDTGTPFLPYLGVAGGASNVTVVLSDSARLAQELANLGLEKTDSTWALGFQGNAGIGYAASEDIVITLGYRLTGTTEAELATSKTKLKLALVHNGEVGLRYIF